MHFTVQRMFLVPAKRVFEDSGRILKTALSAVKQPAGFFSKFSMNLSLRKHRLVSVTGMQTSTQKSQM